MSDGPTIVAVVGPTATGKSDLGIALAKALDGEVINTDSMQLYRGMDVGTAKLTLAERAGIPHHLLDVWDVTETASAAAYQQLARVEVDRLVATGRVAVLVGGSGLYVDALLDRMEFPGTDPELRAALEAELAELGPASLHARLATADPAAAAAILPSNGRRIVRALEVVSLTGSFTAVLPGSPAPYYPAVRIGLDRPVEALDARVDARVEAMWAAGLVDEVRTLVGAGLRAGVTASRALGYAQVLRMFDGELDEPTAIASTQTATRRFVRRQRSWFRRDTRVRWLDAGSDDLTAAALREIERSP